MIEDFTIEFIKSVVRMFKEYKEKLVFLELGLNKGETFNEIIPYATHMHGVDISLGLIPKEIMNKVDNNFINLYESTTDNFFKNVDSNFKVDVAFIDANHTFEFVKRDFKNVLNILSPGGIILMHDQDPVSYDFISNENKLCGNAYKMVNYIIDNYPECNIITLPLEVSGISMVQRKNETRIEMLNKNK